MGQWRPSNPRIEGDSHDFASPNLSSGKSVSRKGGQSGAHLPCNPNPILSSRRRYKMDAGISWALLSWNDSSAAAGKQMQRMVVRPETCLVRPFVVCAILRGVALDKHRYASFIDLQVPSNACTLAHLPAWMQRARRMNRWVAIPTCLPHLPTTSLPVTGLATILGSEYLLSSG